MKIKDYSNSDKKYLTERYIKQQEPLREHGTVKRQKMWKHSILSAGVICLSRGAGNRHQEGVGISKFTLLKRQVRFGLA